MIRLETVIIMSTLHVSERALKWSLQINNVKDTSNLKWILKRLQIIKSSTVAENNKVWYNWFSQFKNFMMKLEVEAIWRENMNLRDVTKISFIGLQGWLVYKNIEKLNSARYNLQYKPFRNNVTIELNLNFKVPIVKTHIIAKLRLPCWKCITFYINALSYHWDRSSHSLICAKYKEKNQKHFLVECPIYEPYRAHYVRQYFPSSRSSSFYFLFDESQRNQN